MYLEFPVLVCYRRNIKNKGEKFQNESGNTFRTYKEFSVEWQSDKYLKVIYDKSSEVYEMDKR